MSKVYLAARYSRREELCRYADQLRELGDVITSRWLNGSHRLDSQGLSVEAAAAERERFATEDWSDLMAADVCIAFTEEPRQSSRNLPKADDMEVWEPVPDSRLGYSISSFGRVQNGSGETITGKHSNGYLRIAPNGRNGNSIGIHQIVAQVFLGPCPEGYEVDHLDGYKNNNWVGNLEYVTHEVNVRRASERMRNGPHAGERNGRAKLTYEDVADIRARAATGESKTQIARDFDVTDVLIGKIVRQALWPINDQPPQGSRHVEFGAALASDKRCVVIGPHENVFYHLPQVEHFDTWEDYIAQETMAYDLSA